MGCQSNNATPPSPAIAPGSDGIDASRAAEAAARRGMDPRLTAVIPSFDAPFFQAGLAGYSDAAMRIIARRHGCPYCVTEALLDRTLLAGGRGFAKADLGEIEDNVPGGAEDHPLAGQIMGSDPREMAAAALKMVEQGQRAPRDYRTLAYERDGVLPSTRADGRMARDHLRLPGGEQLAAPDAHRATGAVVPRPVRTFEVIDVNLACPVKKIDRKARGGHWLTEPRGAIAILEAVRDAVPRGIACAVKLRRAYDDTPEMAANFGMIADAAERLGYAWATVHGRTVEQKYVGPSRWDVLRGIVRRHPGLPILGSGDIWHAADVFRMIAYTGVAAVSVARGCIGNPWVFRQARDLMAGRRPQAPTLAEQRGVLLEHFDLALRGHSGRPGPSARNEEFTARGMRKFGVRFAQHHPRAEEVRVHMTRVSSLADWRAVVDGFYEGRLPAETPAGASAVPAAHA
ncbi:MAG: tRNA-dihydrouridine synthase family protein [Phycisphaerales bacterium]|nr:tRNA-dihydrouridine synthase family protein [Phycisphaerales bacterium]